MHNPDASHAQSGSEAGTSSATPASASTTSSTRPTSSERIVEQASRESFPASDPPSYTPSRSGGVDRQHDDVPLMPVNDDRIAARSWGESLCAALDTGDVDAISGMLTADAMVRIGSASQLVGRDSAREWMSQYLHALGDTIHKIIDVRVDGDAVFIEAEVNVRTHDGVKLMRPEAISARLRDGLASRMIVYGAPSVEPNGSATSSGTTNAA